MRGAVPPIPRSRLLLKGQSIRASAPVAVDGSPESKIKDILSNIGPKANVFGEVPMLDSPAPPPPQRSERRFPIRDHRVHRIPGPDDNDDKPLPPNPPELPSFANGLKSPLFEPISMHKTVEEATELLNRVQRENILDDEELLHLLRLFTATTDARITAGELSERAKAAVYRADMAFLSYHSSLSALEKEVESIKARHSEKLSKIPRPLYRMTRDAGTQFFEKDVPETSYVRDLAPGYIVDRDRAAKNEGFQTSDAVRPGVRLNVMPMPITPVRSQPIVHPSPHLQTPVNQIQGQRRIPSPTRQMQTPLSHASSRPSIRPVASSASPSPVPEPYTRNQSSAYPSMPRPQQARPYGGNAYPSRANYNASALSVTSPSSAVEEKSPSPAEKKSSGYGQRLFTKNPRKQASVSSINTALGDKSASPDHGPSARSRSRLGGFMSDRLKFGSKGKKST